MIEVGGIRGDLDLLSHLKVPILLFLFFSTPTTNLWWAPITRKRPPVSNLIESFLVLLTHSTQIERCPSLSLASLVSASHGDTRTGFAYDSDSFDSSPRTRMYLSSSPPPCTAGSRLSISNNSRAFRHPSSPEPSFPHA